MAKEIDAFREVPAADHTSSYDLQTRFPEMLFGCRVLDVPVLLLSFCCVSAKKSCPFGSCARTSFFLGRILPSL